MTALQILNHIRPIPHPHPVVKRQIELTTRVPVIDNSVYYDVGEQLREYLGGDDE